MRPVPMPVCLYAYEQRTPPTQLDQLHPVPMPVAVHPDHGDIFRSVPMPVHLYEHQQRTSAPEHLSQPLSVVLLTDRNCIRRVPLSVQIGRTQFGNAATTDLAHSSSIGRLAQHLQRRPQFATIAGHCHPNRRALQPSHGCSECRISDATDYDTHRTTATASNGSTATELCHVHLPQLPVVQPDELLRLNKDKYGIEHFQLSKRFECVKMTVEIIQSSPNPHVYK